MTGSKSHRPLSSCCRDRGSKLSVSNALQQLCSIRGEDYLHPHSLTHTHTYTLFFFFFLYPSLPLPSFYSLFPVFLNLPTPVGLLWQWLEATYGSLSAEKKVGSSQEDLAAVWVPTTWLGHWILQLSLWWIRRLGLHRSWCKTKEICQGKKSKCIIYRQLSMVSYLSVLF